MTGRSDALEAFYAPLATSPSAARRVGWEDEDAHRLRLAAAVAAISPLDGVGSVLDAGCGEGALWPVLVEAGFRGAYRGEDLRAAAVRVARARLPEATLAEADVTSPEGPAADAVIACGTFNTVTPPEEPDTMVARGLRALWGRTRSVLVLDVAVAGRHAPGAGVAAIDLPALWTLARELCPAVAVREDLVPGEAQLVLRRHRAPALRRALPGPLAAVARARLLLGGGEPAAAREELRGVTGTEAALWRAVAGAAAGRWRDAERDLRGLLSAPEQADAARVHLAVLLDATRRRAEAVGVLEGLLHAAPPRSTPADEGRLLLARWRREAGDASGAEALVADITDPWIRREAG